MMLSLRKRAPTWFARRAGSQECLLDRPSDPVSTARHKVVRSEFECTSMEIRRLLEEGYFQLVVDILRKLSHEFVRRCLTSFPFKVLNRYVPKSFPVWEILLMKLHNNEEGCIPDFPHAACDELVLQIGALLEGTRDRPRENADLIHVCKRILKKVYMQYNNVLQPLIRENKRIELALYSLSLHLPIGTDSSAVSLHTAIKDEIEACILDYQETLEKIAEIEAKESRILSQMLSDTHQNGRVPNGQTPPIMEFHSPSPSQIQLQERLYSNHWVKRALEPNQRKGNLTQLVEMLKSRIDNDKEVIALYGSIRLRKVSLSDTEAVEPWLRKHQRAVVCCITALKDIEKEIQLGRPSSPTEAGSELSSSLEDTGPDLLTVPILHFRTDEQFVNRAPSARRASAAIPALFNIGEKSVAEGEDMDKMPRRNSVPPPTKQQRPRSTSPMKFLRGVHTALHHGTNGVTQNGAAAVGGGVPENESWKSLYSSRSSWRSLNGRESSSSSIHDLNQGGEEPTQAFRRAQSLKAKGRYVVSPVTPPQLPHLPAGRKKTESHRQSSSNLASTGDSKSSKLKNLFRSGSGGIVTKCDTQQQREEGGGKPAVDSEVTLKLETMNKELFKRERKMSELERSVRELTDRLSEQAQRQLQDSEKFEDIQCASRATVVIRRYEELYCQGRIEALDAIEALQLHGPQDSTGDMDTNNTFDVQFLLEVFKTAYQCAWVYLQQLHGRWRDLFGVPPTTTTTPDKEHQLPLGRGGGEEGEEEEDEGEGGGQANNQTAEKQLESGVMVYLRRVSSQQDLSSITKMLVSRLDAKYCDHTMYTEVKALTAVGDYMEECVKVAWGLCIQTPHMTIDCNGTVYDPEHHKRFFTADKRQTDITAYMWPVLRQFNGPVLVRGIVLT